MLVFPGCKINLGLNVIEKRTDGFHNIETVFYPINWKDALEVIPSKTVQNIEISTSGLPIKIGQKEENILYKAWSLMAKAHKIPLLEVYLHKSLPMGAGLGGGSSDAASFLKILDQKFDLKVPKSELLEMARSLGADCAFFIENAPVFASQKGDVFEKIELDLSAYHILIVYPAINSNTKEAYEGVNPTKPLRNVKDIVLNEPIENWKSSLINDFEKSIFKKYPEVEALKRKLYDSGAIYASMSGSGSACFGIFKEKPNLSFPENYLWHLQNTNL
jgi:4-diphosphocytidyl-2-C-methyl-D-erythritol kinase